MRHAIGVILLFASTLANSLPITYDVNRTVGSVGSVFGTITTDGTIGSLETANIIDWNLLLETGSESILLTASNSGVSINPNTEAAVFAGQRALWFDYSVPPKVEGIPVPLYPSLLFQYGGAGSGDSSWCLSVASWCSEIDALIGWEAISIWVPGVGYDEVVAGHALGLEKFATAVPITSTAWLLGLGLAGLGWLSRRGCNLNLFR